MRIVKANRLGINKAVAALRGGGVIVYPTDTAYGLGGVFDSAAVTKKILQIKRRRDPKFTLVASSRTQAEKFFLFNAVQKKLAKRYWPGPLSIVVSNRFAIRVPASRIARTLCRRLGKPLIATSANVTGQPAAYQAAAVIKQFANKKNQPELMIDAGLLPRQKTSTVVQVVDNRLTVLRAGAVRITYW